MKKEDLAKVEELARKAATSAGVELVDLEYSPTRANPVLRLYIDKRGGVTLEDCARVSRAISDALDIEDPIPHSYRLEVSSPGVNKPLKGEQDYARFKGRPVRITLKRPSAGRSTLSGTIVACKGGVLTIRSEGAGQVQVRLEDVARGRLDVDPWERAAAKRTDGDAS